MKCVCDFHGLLQLVKEPTRNEYLLDLVITGIPGTKVKVLPQIADHKSVLVELPVPEITEVSISREVWKLKAADWTKINAELVNADWRPLKNGTAEDGLKYFLDVLWACLITHIPREKVVRKRSSHPWLNSKCREAIHQKNQAENTDTFKAASETCSQTLLEERAKYVEKLKAKFAANVFAFSFASTIHSLPLRSGGIDAIFAFLCSNSLLIRHHCLLQRGKKAIFAFKFSTYLPRSSNKVWEHVSLAALNVSVFSAWFFWWMASRHFELSHG